MGYKRLVVVAVLGGLLTLSGLVFVGGSYILSDLSDCSGQERAIVEEYPHHGDRRIATYPWTFSCSVRYDTEASRKEVLGYYDEILRHNGWEVMGFQTTVGSRYVSGKRLSDLWGLPQSAGGILVARRDGYSYWASYESPSTENPDPPDNEAQVRVSVNDHPPPASRFPE